MPYFYREHKFESPEDVNIMIAENLKALRKVYNLSQHQCGEVLGCTPQQIQKYENNINRISIGQILLLARYMGVDPEAFLTPQSSQNSSSEILPRHIGECLSYLSPKKRHFLLKVAQELIAV